MSDYSNATNEGLIDLIRQWKEERRKHEEQIAAINTDIAAMQTELNRRALEAFWSMHPDLRLEVGDKLLFTPALAEHKHAINHDYYFRLIGDIVEVKKIYWAKNTVKVIIHHPEKGWDTNCPFDLTHFMREAYLAKEGETT